MNDIRKYFKALALLSILVVPVVGVLGILNPHSGWISVMWGSLAVSIVANMIARLKTP